MSAAFSETSLKVTQLTLGVPLLAFAFVLMAGGLDEVCGSIGIPNTLIPGVILFSYSVGVLLVSRAITKKFGDLKTVVAVIALSLVSIINGILG